MATRSVSSSRQLVRDMGTCLRFNGSVATDNVELTPSSSILSMTAYTVSVWVYPFVSQMSQGGRIFVIRSAGTEFLRIASNTIGTNLAYLIGGTVIDNTTRLNVKNWNHIVFSYDGVNTAKLYINGVLLVTDTSSISGAINISTATMLKVGNTGTLNDRGFNGLIDEVKVYNKALTDNESINLFYGINTNTNSLMLDWRFDEGSGSSANDSSGNGLTGTIGGATYSTNVFMKTRSAASSRISLSGVLPTSISSLSGWWKADSLNLSDNDIVDTWSDSSGNSNDVTGTGTQRPTFKTNMINGYPLIRFNGSTNALVKTGIATSLPITIIAVYQMQNSVNQNGRVIAGNSTNWLMGIRQNRFQVFNSANFVTTGSYLPVVNTPYLHVVTQRTGCTEQYMTAGTNANAYLGQATSGSAPNGLSFGLGSTEYCQCDIAEVILYNKILSKLEITNISYYLGRKYNLTSLVVSRSVV